MATMTVSLPDPLKDWIEERVAAEDFASASDYLRELVRRDRQRQDRDERLDALRNRIAESFGGGRGSRSVGEIFAEAEAEARRRGTWRE